jgi:hypothetical protein
LIVAKDFTTAPAAVFSDAFSTGQKRYIISIVSLNALIIPILTAEALRTPCWRGLPKFCFTDIKSVIIASSLGGHGVVMLSMAVSKRAQTGLATLATVLLALLK